MRVYQGEIVDVNFLYRQYSIEKDEKDPFHWRNRKKEMDKLTSDWDNL
jgi:hypothetical protein